MRSTTQPTFTAEPLADHSASVHTDFSGRVDQMNATDQATEVIKALAESNVAELRFLRVDESDHEICLTGRVRSFYHKQLAQEAIRPVAGGRQVVNRVCVGS
ncbi:BON domain-containing protein [Rhodopirellula sp. JC740]|uniref:BON domain-containing protein n=1 Tax=Rhodopirellula halodulae TaxID=2894198 RepID=A0ABS8NJ93_9BACT|nr:MULTISPECIES: BON domain-containing protein [unclassified Rhodopirellula]MCC9642536.1 BON domain-containing protein [Rhodopirellula sp. JC740]MCC9655909.1 BON domain-containing protein [Rhodopirellula sp. JC737]